MKYIVYVFVTITLIIVLNMFTGCTHDQAYRDSGPEIAMCKQPIALGPSNQECDKEIKAAPCYLQNHIVPYADKWRDEYIDTEKKIMEPENYYLAFVEMKETAEGLLIEDQLDTLKTHLRKSTQSGYQNYVIAYVHGWRHDAAIGNNDVRKFRTLLAYSRSFLNTRCIESANENRYCGARLTGVYIGWRGRSYDEPNCEKESIIHTIGAFPTIWGRKKVSERLAKGDSPLIGQVLTKIQSELSLEPGNAKADKFLIFGHSLGGNMLATYLEPKALTAVRKHSPKQEMHPLIGDLVVIINPAAEAAKWTSIQREMRSQFGLRDDEIWVSYMDKSVPQVQRRKVNNWKEMFATNQRPIYISLTSTNNWNATELRNNSHVAYDSATKYLFPLSRMVVLDFDREKRNTIGHLIPDYKKKNGRNYIAGVPVGVSHEFIVNAPARNSKNGKGSIRTLYSNAGIPDNSWCKVADGWLSRAQSAANYTHRQGWDSLRELKIASNRNNAEIQLRHNLYLENAKNAESVAMGTSPFWNMRTKDGIEEHGGFVTYPMWCGINQLVLDNITQER